MQLSLLHSVVRRPYVSALAGFTKGEGLTLDKVVDSIRLELANCLSEASRHKDDYWHAVIHGWYSLYASEPPETPPDLSSDSLMEDALWKLRLIATGALAPASRRKLPGEKKGR